MRVLIAVLALLMAVLMAAPLAPSALAQSQPQVEQAPPKVVIDRRKLLVQPRGADGRILETPFLEDPVLWMRNTQQTFYSRMSGALRGMRADASSSAGWTLMLLGFLYGMFHAAGPGHGKAVVTGWVLATENQLRRGILIAFMSAAIQALTAIVVVSLLLLLVQGAAAMARTAAGVLETTSYAMIMAMGLYLSWTGLAGLRAAAATTRPAAPAPQPAFELVSRPQAATPLVHTHAPGETCACGHVHMPAAAQVAGAWSWKRATALAFAVGIRPCSGAILVLVFSYSVGLYAAGVAATIAMGLGVFITISAIAALAVFSKTVALKYMRADHPVVTWAVRGGKVVMGLFIAGLGLLLLLGSLGPTTGLT